MGEYEKNDMALLEQSPRQYGIVEAQNWNEGMRQYEIKSMQLSGILKICPVCCGRLIFDPDTIFTICDENLIGDVLTEQWYWRYIGRCRGLGMQRGYETEKYDGRMCRFCWERFENA